MSEQIKCPACGKINEENWPLYIGAEIKEGGCQMCWESNEYMAPKESLKVGQRIIFLKTLTSNDSEESPGCHFASKGDFGIITKIGGCWEGYWVKWDGWSQADFGCERKNFDLVKEAESIVEEGK